MVARRIDSGVDWAKRLRVDAHLVGNASHVVAADGDGRPGRARDGFAELALIFIELADALGVIGEDLLALEGNEVVELVRAALFGSAGEGADHGEGGQEVRDTILAHEADQAIDHRPVALHAVADAAAEVGHEPVNIGGMALHEFAAGERGEQPEDAPEAIEECAGAGELVARAAAEHALGDAGIDQLAVVVHHPVDDDFVAAAMKLVGQAHVADDGAFEGAAGEGEEAEDGRGHAQRLRAKGARW